MDQKKKDSGATTSDVNKENTLCQGTIMIKNVTSSNSESLQLKKEDVKPKTYEQYRSAAKPAFRDVNKVEISRPTTYSIDSSKLPSMVNNASAVSAAKPVMIDVKKVDTGRPTVHSVSSVAKPQSMSNNVSTSNCVDVRKLQDELAKRKQLYKSIPNVQTLPDKGFRLLEQIKQLETAIVNMQLDGGKKANITASVPVSTSSASLQQLQQIQQARFQAANKPIVISIPRSDSKTDGQALTKPVLTNCTAVTQGNSRPALTINPGLQNGFQPAKSVLHNGSLVSSASVLKQPQDGVVKYASKPTVVVYQGERPGERIIKVIHNTGKLPVHHSLPKQTQMLGEALPLRPDDLHLKSAGPQTFGQFQGYASVSAEYKRLQNLMKEAVEKLHKSMESCPAPTSELEDPPGLNVPLMLHQRQALSWLVWRENQHPAGGILADDMGLGKTLTMISLVVQDNSRSKESLKQSEEDGWMAKGNDKLQPSSSTLVICPASLIHQWEKEVANRCRKGTLKTLVYHGPNRERNVKRLSKYDLVITTYNIVSQEASASIKEGAESSSTTSPLAQVSWRRIILDEAHTIKNIKSQCAQAVCALTAERRWAVTGTPLHNDLSDLRSLVKFLRCSPFDEQSMWKRLTDIRTAQYMDRVNTLIKAMMLRRTKDQKATTGDALVPLPKRSEYVHKLNFSPEEKAVYDKIFAMSKSLLVNHLQNKTGKDQSDGLAVSTVGGSKPIPGSTASNPALSKENIRQAHVLVMLLRLRQCCSHPSLLKQELEDGDLQSEGVEMDLIAQMTELSLQDVDTKVPGIGKLVMDKNTPSTKVKALLKELRKIKEQSLESGTPMKSVVVSQWTSMLDLVAQFLKAEGIKYHVIRGDVPVKTRGDLVHDFNSNPRGPTVMLISLKAGGVGLNLVGANHLFLIDMHWNPALEQQACDRIYRVGQARDVHIHRFVIEETIEQRIVDLQQGKLSLANRVLVGDGAKQSGAAKKKRTLEDLRLLFGV